MKDLRTAIWWGGDSSRTSDEREHAAIPPSIFLMKINGMKINQCSCASSSHFWVKY